MEIIENPLIVNNQNATVATTANLTGNNGNNGRKLCGDWSSKLKLLRYVSKGSKLKLKFSSDYSHHYGGYKARISMENGKFVRRIAIKRGEGKGAKAQSRELTMYSH